MRYTVNIPIDVHMDADLSTDAMSMATNAVGGALFSINEQTSGMKVILNPKAVTVSYSKEQG